MAVDLLWHGHGCWFPEVLRIPDDFNRVPVKCVLIWWRELRRAVKNAAARRAATGELTVAHPPAWT